MSFLPAQSAAVPPVLNAALLLLALPALVELGLDHPTVAQVLAATKASRSRAYELRAVLGQLLPRALRPPGRPPKPAAPLVDTGRLVRLIRDFAFDHPGAVSGTGSRRRYSDAFRRFVLDQAAAHRDIGLEVFAEAVGVPLATLRDWLGGGLEHTRPPDNRSPTPVVGPTEPQIETVLAAWKTWQGAFTRFCTHVQQDWRIPFGRQLIADLLAAHGVRFAKRRSGRSPDEDAIRGQFVVFFPNAQWVGDGSPLDVSVGDETFTFNVELMVDPCSGAVVGASVRDTEDAAAVIEAFEDAVVTTGASPLAVLLDNKPSNHAEVVQTALGDTDIVRATPYRPQTKGHVEGAFGLFQQIAPALVLALTSPHEVARQLLEKVVTTWARTLNHKPRVDRGEHSRVELHLGHIPTPEEVEGAKVALKERIHRQELARQTRAARQDPLVRQTLADAFVRLKLEDPGGDLLNAIARYPLDAVVAGIAIIEGRARAGTLPAGIDARYLLGCVRNVSEEREGWEIALALWTERRRAGDRALEAVERQRERLVTQSADPARLVAAYVDHALATARRLDRFHWLAAAADVVIAQERVDREPLFRLAARRVHATHAVPHRDRLAATRFLAAKILPIE